MNNFKERASLLIRQTLLKEHRILICEMEEWKRKTLEAHIEDIAEIVSAEKFDKGLQEF